MDEFMSYLSIIVSCFIAFWGWKMNQKLKNIESKLQRINKLYEKRLVVIENLCEKLVLLEDNLYTLVTTKIYSGTQEDFYKWRTELFKSTITSFNEFSSYYRVNEIFFSKNDEIINHCNILLEEFKKSFLTYDFYQNNFTEHDTEIKRQELEELSETVRKEIPKTVEKLKNRFRELVEVEKITK